MTDLDLAHTELDAMEAEAATERAAAQRGTPCWACDRRLARCRRQGCPRVWRLRDPIKLATGGANG